MPSVKYLDLGLISYEKALRIQEEEFNRLLNAKLKGQELEDAGVLILCEHPSVYTLGRNATDKNFISNPAEVNAEVHKIGRGGDVTFHGPGQIVGYPILNLEKWPIGLARYVYLLEETIIATLSGYEIYAERTKKAPGVWINYDSSDARKIAALGIQSSRWVTMHGFAFNVNTNLDFFNNIIPCGIPDKSVTSMQKELNVPQNIETVKSQIKRQFESLFEITWLKEASPSSTSLQ